MIETFQTNDCIDEHEFRYERVKSNACNFIEETSDARTTG